MYSNYLEARKFFAKWHVKDIFDAINKITIDNAVYPYNEGTWDTGFFFKMLTDSLSNTDFCKALEVAHIGPADIDYVILPRLLDKYVSMGMASKIARRFGDTAWSIEHPKGIRDFDPRNPLDEVTMMNTWTLRVDIIQEVNDRFGASLLATAKAYFESEYNPIENYSMEQVETPDITHTKSGTSSETETPNITETIHTEANSKLKTDGSSSGNVYGFGSSASTPLNEGESTQTTQGSKDDNYTDSERRETGTRSVSGSSGETEKETGTRRLTRSGNIGVTTSQQMLQSEIELRKFDFLEEVFKCFDKVICASVY